MKPIVIYSNKFLNSVSWFMSVGAISLFPFIILRERYEGTKKGEEIINHETIHFKQTIELLIIPFYILYVIEWFIKLFFYGGKSYYNISFEREAYSNENNLEYNKNRKLYSWVKYLFNHNQ